MSTEPISAFTFRTVAVIENQWISIASTTMETDSLPYVEAARVENLQALHQNLAVPPPMDLGRGSTWREPKDDMMVTITDTIVKHDLMTGATLDERPLEPYNILYRSMNPEEN